LSAKGKLAAVPEDISALPPPHAPGAEQALLGTLMMTPSLFGEVSALVLTDDFYLPAHREIWDAMVAVSSRGHEADAPTVWDELVATGHTQRLSGGPTYLTQLCSEGFHPRLRQYVRLVLDASVRRAVVREYAEVASAARGNSYETRALLTALRAGLIKLLERQKAVEAYVLTGKQRRAV